MRRAVQDTNAVWVVHGKTVSDILLQQARDAGFSIGEVGQAFVRLETGTKNTATSLKDLGIAENIARGRHIELAQAAGILSRAEQGSDTALRRLGIIIPSVTKNVSELKREHSLATVAGVKFTAAQNETYKVALAQAKGLDAQASRTRVLAEVQSRFGGQSATFARTTAGEFARLRENIGQFEAGVARDLFPVLNQGFEGLSHWVDELRTSDGVHHAATRAVHGFADGVRTAKSAVEFFIPPLKIVASVVEELGHITGAGGILAFAAGFKTVSAIVSVAGSVQQRYQQVLAAGESEQAGITTGLAQQTVGYNALTGAVERNTIATRTNAVAQATSARIVGTETDAGALQAGSAYLNLAEGVSTAGTATVQSTAKIAEGASAASESLLNTAADSAVLTDSVASAGARLAKTGAEAGTLGTKLGTLGRGLFELAGGWTTVAAVGIGAVAFGLFKLFTQETAVERANEALAGSLERLDAGFIRSAGLARDYASALSSVRSDRVAIQAGEANVALARQALATTDAARGSAEYEALVAQLASAIDALRVAENSLSSDEARAASSRRDRIKQDAANEQQRSDAIQRTIDLSKAAAREATVRTFSGGGRLPLTAESATANRIEAAAKASHEFADGLDKDAEKLSKGNPPLRAQIVALAELSRILGHIPSEQTITVALDAKNAKEAVQGIVFELERVRPQVNGFAEALRLEAASVAESNQPLARRLTLLADFSKAIGRVPTHKETEVALKTPSFKDAVELLSTVLAQMHGRAQAAGFATGKAYAENFVAGEKAGGGLTGLVSGLIEAAAAMGGKVAGGISDSTKQERDAAKASLDAVNASASAVDSKIAEVRATVQTATRDLADANRGLADAIRSGNQQIRDAVAQADQNLFSIGSSLSDAIGQFLDAQEKAGKLTSASPKQLAQFKTLRQQILSGEGGDEAARAAQRLAGEIENGQGAAGDVEKRKERVKRDVTDLVDQFNKGAITLATFNRRLAGILAREGITYKAAGKTLGVAFADGFRAEVQGIKDQAAAIAAGPHFRGITGVEPSIVRPLEAVQTSQRQIADAQRRRDDAIIAEAKAEKHLHSLEESHTRLALAVARDQTRYHRLNEQHLRFMLAEERKQTAALTKKPPPLRTPRPGAEAAANARIMAEHGF